MTSYRVSLVALGMVSALAACTRAQEDCSLNPALDCFKATTGSGGNTSSGGASAGGNAGAAGSSSGGMSAGGNAGAAGSSAGSMSAGGNAGQSGAGGMMGCVDATQCSAKDCNNVSCDAGQCVYSPDDSLTCAGGTCMGGACATCDDGVKNGAEADVDCGGTCSKGCGPGTACAAGSDCESDSCADGVCCESDCKGPCVSCGQSGSPGICALLPAGTVDMDECPGANNACSRDGVCHQPNNTGCMKSGECASHYCSNMMSGTCKPCADSGQCGPDICDNGACYKPEAQGHTCADSAGCESGECVDGVCCESKCDGLCMGCSGVYTGEADGICAPIKAGYDPRNECNGSSKAAFCGGTAPGGNGNSACGN